MIGDSAFLGWRIQSGAGFGQLVAARRLDVDLAFVLPGLGEVVSHLQPQPRFRAAAKCLVETDRHVGGNAALAVDQIVEGCRVTPNAAAASVIVRPSGSMQSCRTERPGWSGFFIVIVISPVL
jgi:hypothetical protein